MAARSTIPAHRWTVFGSDLSVATSDRAPGQRSRSFSSPPRSMPMTCEMDSFAPVQLPDDVQRRLNVAKATGALLLIAVWGWFALVKGDQTPVFVYLNIAVHEIGHILFRPFGELTMLIMGSGFEVLFPLAVGAYFLLRKRDVVSTAVAWGWAASALASAATYIGDADDGQLALLGATGPDAAGDWERILGVEFVDKVYLADRIAEVVRTVGFVLWGVALCLAVLAIVRNRQLVRTAGAGPKPRATAEPRAPLVPIQDEEMWR